MSTRSTISLAALVFGVVFLVVGLLGFIPGITTGSLGGASDSDALLLDTFQVSVLHNLVHILFGVVGIVASRNVANSRQYLLVGGIIYLVLFLYGLVIDQASSANFIPVNNADNVLHLLLGAAMVASALLLTNRKVNV